MKSFDVAVIGGGVLGCFAARNLMRYRLSVVLIEAREDVCMEITRANSAIIYAGYDHHPGSLKASLTVRANSSFDDLSRKLDVPFSRCGSLMTAYGEQGLSVLRKKLDQGQKNGVPNLRLISGDEAREIEPMLSSSVRSRFGIARPLFPLKQPVSPTKSHSRSLLRFQMRQCPVSRD